MALNRRTLLLGLVVLVVGAGIIGGTGAFSSVQADRTMNLNTTGDSAALLQFNNLDSDIAQTQGQTSTGGVPVLQVTQDELNADAKTIFVDAFTIENGGDENIDELYIRTNSTAGIESGGLVDFKAGGANGQSIVGNSVSLGAGGGTVNVTVVIDTTGSVTYEDLQDANEITVVANDTSAAGV